MVCHRNGCAEAATVLNMAIDGNILLYCSSLTVANCIYNCRKILGKETAFLLLKNYLLIYKYLQWDNLRLTVLLMLQILIMKIHYNIFLL